MHGLRPEYQDRVNFVILDYEAPEELALAQAMGAGAHPAFVLLPPDGGPSAVAARAFGPLHEVALRRLLDQALSLAQ